MHYLDYAASAPMRPEAAAVYARATELFGNAASVHAAGRAAKHHIEQARDQVARSIGADGVELIFTGSGTEAINLAIKGLFWMRVSERPVIVLPEGEHHATLDTVEWLERQAGAQLVWVPLDREGRIRLDHWQQALEQHAGRVALATALWANNEVGTVQPVLELAQACAHAGVPLHLDAVAAYGHEPLDVHALRTQSGSGEAGLVALSISAHKIGGPQGVGALYLAREAKLESLVHGGGQQRRLRSGTENVLGSLAFAAASEAMLRDAATDRATELALRDRLIAGITSSIPTARINGSLRERLSNNVHVSFAGCESDSLLFLLDQAGIAVSSGSACQAGVIEVSHVVRALGYSEDDSRGSLRMTFGRGTTNADIDALLDALPAAVAQAQDAGLAARQTRFDAR